MTVYVLLCRCGKGATEKLEDTPERQVIRCEHCHTIWERNPNERGWSNGKWYPAEE